MNINEAIDDLYTILSQHNGEYMDYASYEAAVDNLNIISNFVAGTRWIPVSERLPSGDVASVLIYTKDGGIGEGQYYPTINAWKQFRWSVEDAKVTHWMPLPKLPEVE